MSPAGRKGGFIGLVSAVVVVAAGLASESIVAATTYSGLLGICGPYGDYTGLLMMIIFVTPLLSLLVGLALGIHFYGRSNSTPNEAEPGATDNPTPHKEI
jgi:hypothetical protein